jgi:hypothetical protein
MIHDVFNTGNFYEVISVKGDLIELKVKGKIVTAKKDNFIIEPCLFNEENVE